MFSINSLKLRVCVTKELPLEELNGLRDQFVAQRLFFGMVRSMSGWTLWREVLPEDSKYIIHEKPPKLGDFSILYIQGRLHRDRFKTQKVTS